MMNLVSCDYRKLSNCIMKLYTKVLPFLIRVKGDGWLWEFMN